MIYYFSGTGNSRFVARHIAQATGERLEIMGKYSRHIGSEMAVLGFIFPVYGWRLPRIVEQFIQQIKRGEKPLENTYTFAVLTCGDDIGHAHHLLRRALETKGIKLNAVFSVIMPNTYVSLPGFNIDPPDLQRNKMKQCMASISRITAAIIYREEDLTEVRPGAFSWFKTYILGRMFKTCLMSDRFFSTTAKCVSCRKCEAVCPVHNININQQGRPVWQGHCTMCLACYHHCPVHCIEYGMFTRNKGQYICKS